MALINFKIHIKTVIRMNISQFFTETWRPLPDKFEIKTYIYINGNNQHIVAVFRWSIRGNASTGNLMSPVETTVCRGCEGPLAHARGRRGPIGYTVLSVDNSAAWTVLQPRHLLECPWARPWLLSICMAVAFHSPWPLHLPAEGMQASNHLTIAHGAQVILAIQLSSAVSRVLLMLWADSE